MVRGQRCPSPEDTFSELKGTNLNRKTEPKDRYGQTWTLGGPSIIG